MRQARHSVPSVLAVLLLLASCSTPVRQTPTATPPHSQVAPTAIASATATATVAAPSPAPTTPPTPIPTPTPSPYPTATPGPSPTPIPSAVLRATEAPQEALAGTELVFQIAGLKPLERANVYLAGPGGSLDRLGAQRADRSGTITWDRDSTHDATGSWAVHIQGEGDLGTRLVVRYTLKELALPTDSEVQGGTRFLVYRTPTATFHFEPGIHTASVRRIADLAALAAAYIPRALDFSFKDHLDFYLLATPEALQREIVSGGAQAGGGHEAGVSLYGFKRSGIYIDMSSPAATLPHVVAHEMSHQIAARFEGSRDIPHWLEEGLADYFGTTVARALEPGQERGWRRQTRDLARKAARQGTWVDLGSLAKTETWFFEQDFTKASLYYSEGYVAADFVAQQYGDEALKFLLGQMADSPDDADGVTRRLLGLPFQDFQEKVQAGALQLDDYEVQVQAMIDYARVMLRITDDEGLISQDWNTYLSQRSALKQHDRVVRVQDLLARYQALASRAKATPTPAPAAEAQSLYAEALNTLAQAMASVLSFEQGSSTTVSQANTALQQGNFLLAAAQDRLMTMLNRQQIRVAEVLPGKTP